MARSKSGLKRRRMHIRHKQKRRKKRKKLARKLAAVDSKAQKAKSS